MRKRPPKRSTAPSLEEIPVTIDSLGAQGDGVARINGQAVHVPLAVSGDHINLTYDTKTLRSAGFSLYRPALIAFPHLVGIFRCAGMPAAASFRDCL